MKISLALGILLVLILSILFYILFELQNGWPFNEDIFIYLQTISAVSIVATVVMTIAKPSRIYSAVPLLMSFTIVSLISRSSLSAAGIISNLLIIILILLISYSLKREGGRIIRDSN